MGSVISRVHPFKRSLSFIRLTRFSVTTQLIQNRRVSILGTLSIRIAPQFGVGRLAVIAETFLSYGGDWQPTYPNDDNFCVNGLISPDREVQPELWDVKKVYQSIEMHETEPIRGEIEVTNRYLFTDLDAFTGTWVLKADGEAIQSGTLSDLELPPGESREIEIPLEKPELRPGADYWLDVRFTLPEDTRWASKGHEVAAEQFEIPYDVPESTERHPGKTPPLRVGDSDETVTVNGAGFRVRFDRK